MELYIKDNNGDFIPIELEDVVNDVNFDWLIETDNNSAEFTVKNGWVELDDVDVWIDKSDIHIELINAIKNIYLGDVNQFHVTPKE